MLTNSQVRALERVAKTRDQLRAGELVLRRQVIEARGAGASWGAIAHMLGISKQAACKKYGFPVRRAAEPALF